MVAGKNGSVLFRAVFFPKSSWRWGISAVPGCIEQKFLVVIQMLFFQFLFTEESGFFPLWGDYNIHRKNKLCSVENQFSCVLFPSAVALGRKARHDPDGLMWGEVQRQSRLTQKGTIFS